MLILGVETSCDETAVSVVKDGVVVLSNTVATSLPLHAKTGGIVPETAAREQLKYIVPTIQESLKESDINPTALDALAVTYGPGLLGSLLIGVEAIKTLGFVWNKPIVPINHLVGHIYANWLNNPEPPSFPNLTLIVSGGHSELVLMKGHGQFTWLGGTRDDAAGEAFDKTARLLGLTYPGGPAIQQRSSEATHLDNSLPRPLSASTDFDFSFSGLKTAVATLVGHKTLTKQEVSNFAASIQEAIVDSLLNKTLKAADKYPVKEILLAGGVAANHRLRDKLTASFKGKVHAPAVEFCVDNGAMVASAAFFNYQPVPWGKVHPDTGLLI